MKIATSVAEPRARRTALIGGSATTADWPWTVQDRARICCSSAVRRRRSSSAGWGAASGLSSWFVTQRSWVSSSAVTSSSGGRSGTTRPEMARARSSQASTDVGRSAAISSATTAAARLTPCTVLEVCRSRLPNWAWYLVRSANPARAWRSPDDPVAAGEGQPGPDQAAEEP